MTPDGWVQTTLEQVADVAIGRTPARDEKSNWDPGKTTQNRWATIANIKGKFIGETTEYISDLGVQHSNARLVPPGTLLMSFKLSLGRVAITSTPMYTNEAIAAFYPNGLANTEYLYYLLPTLALEESSDRAVKGQTLNKAKLRALQLVLPPADEQRKIAAILSSLDDAIGKTQAVIDQVQVVKRGLMQELLTRGLPGRHTRFQQTAIGEVPEDWVVDKIGQLGQKGKPAVKAGPFGSSLRKSYYVSEGYRVYGQEQVLAGDLSVGDYYIDKERFKSLRSCEVRAGDILVSLVGTFGKAVVVPANAEPGIINPRLLRLSLDPQLVLPEFFCFWLRNGGTQKLLADAAQGGTMGVLNAGIVKSLLLGRPPLPEQAEIVAIMAAVERRLHREAAMNAAAVRAKTALMAVLLTGELRVTQDPATP